MGKANVTAPLRHCSASQWDFSALTLVGTMKCAAASSSEEAEAARAVPNTGYVSAFLTSAYLLLET